VYRRSGVATTFSPRFLAVLSEAGRIAQALGASLELIHADNYEAQKEERFREALSQLKLPENAVIHFEPGDPAESILQVRQAANLDLLMAGALERESVHRNFTGNVARELLRRAPCDLFLFVEPNEEPRPMASIYVAIPDFLETSRQVFHQALDLAEKVGTEEVTVLLIQTTFAEAKEKALGNDVASPEESWNAFVQERTETSVSLDFHLIRGNTGFTAFEYLQSSGANLLVVPSERTPSGEPVFAPVLDWIIQVIPTNLWVIREKAVE
jgi:nucleotide-binding universal stress UspA family protein